MTEAAHVLERRDNVVFLHREGWTFFEEKSPEIEGLYLVYGSSDNGEWFGLFDMVEDSLIGEVEEPNPWPVAFLRVPSPPAI